MRVLLVLILLLVTSLVLQAGLVAFAGYVLLGVYVLSRWLTRRWVRDLEVVRECNARPREIGESAEVVVTLTNRGPLPVLWVLVEDLIPDFHLRQKPPRLTVKGKRIRLLTLGPRGRRQIRYTVTFRARGYYPLGPAVLETGDVFGLHRRHRAAGKPVYVLVYPKVVPLSRYDFATPRPIGEIRPQDRLWEDPTRTAGVREYRVGDPLPRVHWKATARTGSLQCRVYEPSTPAGATILLDFHADGYPPRGEPYRSELAVTVAASLAYAVSVQRQPLGFVSNGRDAADRIRDESFTGPGLPAPGEFSRDTVRDRYEWLDRNDRLRPVVVETRRSFDQFRQVRVCLARLELTDGLTFARLVSEVAPRLSRQSTVIAVLPRVPVESALALGLLRRLGFLAAVVLVGLDESDRLTARARLLAEGVRDVRFVNSEEELAGAGTSPPPSAGDAVYDVEVSWTD